MLPGQQQQQQLGIGSSKVPSLPPLPGAPGGGGARRSSSAGTGRPSSTGSSKGAAAAVAAVGRASIGGLAAAAGGDKAFVVGAASAEGVSGASPHCSSSSNAGRVGLAVKDGLGPGGRGEAVATGGSAEGVICGEGVAQSGEVVSWGAGMECTTSMGSGGAGPVPAIAEGEGGEGAGPAGEQLPGRLEIQHLSWEDRERVLRLLFAKINNHARQVHFSSLPSHPFSVQAEQPQQQRSDM